MGIPSYFFYIVRNHPEIIQLYTSQTFNVDNLYLDCNSIIYDIYHELIKVNIKSKSFTKEIIKNVCERIHKYINIIKPKNTVYITFDGVAPMAKLEQQRSRRYKSFYQNEIYNQIYNLKQENNWSTSEITPGTLFMKNLSIEINKYFKNAKKFNVTQLFCSSSEEVGEGEHKIFKYIRDNQEKHSNEITFIYGLDADLIMLCINHLTICPNIYLYRETPHFIRSIDNNLEPNKDYILDIKLLTKKVLQYMCNDISIYKEDYIKRIYDYVFLSFFLGNDFLPHFPAINIRTGGMDKLLDAYRDTICKTDKVVYLIDNKKIIWNNVRKLVKYLMEKEEIYIINEYNLRNKKENIYYPIDTPENIYKKFDIKPTIERDIEKYINPTKEYWQSRYYRALCGIKSDSTGCLKKNICINYLEGLEWTFQYYINDCIDWRWHYKYIYPPLLVDLYKYIPIFDTTFLPINTNLPVAPLTQLCYVLPKPCLYIISNEKLVNKILQLHPEWYSDNNEFIWAYCKYFWESHVLMNEINIDELDILIRENQ